LRRMVTASLSLALVLSAVLTPSPTVALDWGPIRAITSDEQGYAWPGSTVDYLGGVAVAYRHIVGGEYGAYVRRSSDGGSTWKAPIKLSTDGTLASRPALAARTDRLDAVFTQSSDGGETSRVIYRTSSNGGATWSSPIPLSPTGTVAGLPSVARSGSRVVVAWTDAVRGKVSIRVRESGATPFKPKTNLATSVNQPFVQTSDSSIEAWAAVAFADGIINVVYYTTDTTLKVRRSGNEGDSWTAPVTLAADGDGLMLSLAGGASQARASLLIGYTMETAGGANGHAAYRRSVDRGKSWSAPAAFSGASAPTSFGPVVSFSSSRWRVAFERCADEGCAETRIYYRQSTDAQSWGVASTVTSGPGTFAVPAGVTYDDGNAIVCFVSVDDSGGSNVVVRQGN
jgi:Neuraminidase (sialidase)